MRIICIEAKTATDNRICNLSCFIVSSVNKCEKWNPVIGNRWSTMGISTGVE